MADILKSLSDAVWGLPTAGAILLTGIWLTAKFRLAQLREIPKMLRPFSKDRSGGVTASQSLATALAATVGTGSVIGVGAAIAEGGAGAVFWLWVSAFFGMATARAEGILSIVYRKKLSGGARRGGIWYAIRDGLKMPRLSRLYALLCVGASFGMGCAVQTNSAAAAVKEGFGVDPAICGVCLAALLGVCLFGRGFAGRLCEKTMPFMAGLYLTGAAAIIFVNIGSLPGVIERIFCEAFGLKQAAGGFFGYLTIRALSVGCRRGVFSNEAGLGTTAPLHGASDNCDPLRQGQMNMAEVAIDTFICTVTALAILCSGAEGGDGASLVMSAASGVFGRSAGKLVSLCIFLFAAATAVGWSQIGLSAAEYVFGKAAIYRAAFLICAFAGPLLSLGSVWAVSDILNGLMAFPCLFAIIRLFRGYSLPEEPKPAVPLSVSGRESATAVSGKSTGTVTS